MMAAAAGMFLAGLLAWSAAVDARSMILPDALTLALALGGVAASLALGEPPLSDALGGALAGGGFLALVSAGYRALRGVEGLGFGDVKLVAAGGLWTGWQGLPPVVLTASVGALVFIFAQAARHGGLERGRRIPFGPFLAAGIALTWGLRMLESGILP